ncbi:Translation elongation factor EF1B/ribosomal protein S6 family protein [Perilla frutescens var. frutescens]|nr:Translation elongation factor EF1B/ribosomal protein S6 family protein [Perilla frutescens var. frutescens]
MSRSLASPPLDALIAGKSYISGTQLANIDVEVYAAVEKPSTELYSNANKIRLLFFTKLAVADRIQGFKMTAMVSPEFSTSSPSHFAAILFSTGARARGERTTRRGSGR